MYSGHSPIFVQIEKQEEFEGLEKKERKGGGKKKKKKRVIKQGRISEGRGGENSSGWP